MNKRVVILLLAGVGFLTTGCNNKGGGGDDPDPDPSDVIISVEEAKEFIKNNYTGHELKIPNKDDTLIRWNIEKDKDDFGAKHINKYLVDPTIDDKVGASSGETSITTERANTFKSELEDLTNPDKLGFIGYEAAISLTPLTFDALVIAQGSEYYYLTINKIKNQSLTITSVLKDENNDRVYTRIHTYNSDGYESKFELTYRDTSMDYSFSINFKY